MPGTPITDDAIRKVTELLARKDELTEEEFLREVDQLLPDIRRSNDELVAAIRERLGS